MEELVAADEEGSDRVAVVKHVIGQWAKRLRDDFGSFPLPHTTALASINARADFKLNTLHTMLRELSSLVGAFAR